MELNFRLNAFEGPLDLLLQLIAKHRLNIFDIEITVLVEQYLSYMDELPETDFNQQSEFLEMAARLIYIKVLSLLPKKEEANEMKRELEGALIDYAVAKLTAARLRELFTSAHFTREPMKLPADPTYRRSHQPDELLKALLGMSAKSLKQKKPSIEGFCREVQRPVYPVTAKLVAVLKKLCLSGSARLDEDFYGKDRSQRVAAFLAVLELTRAGRIVLNSDNSEIRLSPMVIERRRRERAQ